MTYPTRRTTVYRMIPAKRLRALVAPKVAAEPDRYTMANVRVAGLPALLVAGQTEAAEIEWTATVRGRCRWRRCGAIGADVRAVSAAAAGKAAGIHGPVRDLLTQLNAPAATAIAPARAACMSWRSPTT